MQPVTISTSFLKKEQRSRDAYSFYFKKKDLQYLPGQYVRLILKVENPDQRGNSRFFTLSSSPTEDDLIITTRILESAFKKTLINLRSDDEVSIFGPLGKFTLDETDFRPRIFLAGGIGITPYRSMIKYAFDKNLNIPITLFASFKTVEDYAYRDFFHDVVAKNKWLKIVETITQPGASQTPWSGYTGRIDADLIKKNVADLKNSLFFISGPPTMVDALKEIVKTLYVNDENILLEKFSGY